VVDIKMLLLQWCFFTASHCHKNGAYTYYLEVEKPLPAQISPGFIKLIAGNS